MHARESINLMEALINSYANSPYSKGLNPNVMNKTQSHTGNKGELYKVEKCNTKVHAF